MNRTRVLPEIRMMQPCRPADPFGLFVQETLPIRQQVTQV